MLVFFLWFRTRGRSCSNFLASIVPLRLKIVQQPHSNIVFGPKEPQKHESLEPYEILLYGPLTKVPETSTSYFYLPSSSERQQDGRRSQNLLWDLISP